MWRDGENNLVRMGIRAYQPGNFDQRLFLIPWIGGVVAYNHPIGNI